MDHPKFNINKRPGTILGNNLSTWKLVADQFYKSSECIFCQVLLDRNRMMLLHLKWEAEQKWPDFNYTPTLDQIYFLQIGYCLENMIKGILTFRDSNLLAGGKLSNKVKSHDLAILAPMTAIDFTYDEQKLFEFLTPHVQWYGKYPIPAKASESIGFSFHKIEDVRGFFISAYRKLSTAMEATGVLKEHMHNYTVVL